MKYFGCVFFLLVVLNKGDYIFQMMVRLEVTQLETQYISYIDIHSREKFPKQEKKKKNYSTHFQRKIHICLSHISIAIAFYFTMCLCTQTGENST